MLNESAPSNFKDGVEDSSSEDRKDNDTASEGTSNNEEKFGKINKSRVLEVLKKVTEH